LKGLTIRNGDVCSEARTANGAGCGGAVYCTMGAAPTISNCVFENNRASFGGGAIDYESDAGAPTLAECTFVNNSTVGAGTDGGAVRSGSVALMVHGCTFRDNSATWNGGAVSSYGNVTLSNCQFTGNSAQSGGAVSCGAGLSLTNCLLAHNSATDSGGAAYAPSPGSSRGAPLSQQIQVQGCTFAANSAPAGRALAWAFLGAQAVVHNCILWDGGSEVGGTGNKAIATVTYSDIQGGANSGGSRGGAKSDDGNINLDPAFVDADHADFHLSRDSPCIDRGDPGYTPAPDESDIDGELRIAGGRIDMGADEYIP